MTNRILMTILSVGVASCMAANGSPGDPPLACKMSALSRTERPRLQQLVSVWKAAVLDRSDVSNGYLFRIDPSKASVVELAEWISLEHKCCSFFRFRLDAGEDGSLAMTVGGGPGVKAFMKSEFQLPDQVH